MKLKQITFKVISLIMVIAMMFSISATTIGAVEWTHAGHTHENGKDEIYYVSLGDSMTNGYGLPGYDMNSGVADYGDGSYANLFAQWLGQQGAAVNHAQLAMSAMRAEDLHWLLELDYTDAEAIALAEANEFDEEAWNAKFTTGDYWTWDEICTHSRTRSTITAIKATGYDTEGYDGVALIAKYYQDAVANGDILSLGMGNGNFGVFMFGRILEAIGFSGSPDEAMIYTVENAIRELDPEKQAKILALKADLDKKVDEFIASEGNNMAAETVEALANTVVYTCLSFVINYAGTVEAMVELNPDADIILVALMNTFASESEVEGLSLGKLLDSVYTPLNAFIAALPTYMSLNGNDVAAEFYYAEAESVECIVDVYESEIGNTDSVVRERFVESIVGGGNGMVWQLLSGVQLMAGVSIVPITLADIEAFEANPYNVTDPNKSVSCAVYLAFEDAIIDSSKAAVTADAILGLKLDAALFAGVMTEFGANIGANSASYFVQVLTAVAADNGVNDFATAQYLYNNNSAIKSGVDMLCMLFAVPETLSAALQSDPAIAGLLGLFARCIIGNGIGSHPSAVGHEAVADAVINAYETGYTTESETIKNALIAAGILKDLAEEYYDEAYAYAHAELVADGTIGEINAALDAAIEAVVAAQAEVEGLEVEARLEETKALLVSELVLTEATLYQIKTLVNYETITAENLETLELLVENLKAHLENLGELAVEVGGIALEVIEYAANEAAKLANEIVSKVYAYVIDKAPEVYAAFVNAVVEAVKYYSHEAAIYCYNWLYNNPEKVIGFFAEYGDDIAEFIAENSEIIFGVIGYVGTNYGEEIVDLLLDNADVILPAIAGWYEIHGEYVWDLVKVYFETIIGYIDFDLDLDFTSPEGIHESLNKIFLLLGELVEKIADGVYDYVESLGILEEIEAELAKLGLKLKEAAIAGAIELGEFICETICKFVDWAISGKFTPTEDSYYVSVNGGNAYYAELLAGKLAENLDIDSIKLGTTTWDNLDYEMLSKADLVTIGYDENELSGFAVEQMLAYVVNYVDETLRGDVTEYVSGVYAILQGWIDGNELNYDLGQHEEETLAGLNGTIDELLAYEIIAGKELSDMDWAKYVGEENLSYVEEVRAALKAELLESGVIETYTYTIDVVEYIYENYEALGISAEALAVVPKTTAYKVLGEKAYYTVEVPVADSIVFAAESYLYGNVEFQAEYCKLVLDLYEINPEATVILLGAYNAYDLELTLGDVAVNLGEVYGYVAGLASVQPVAYALLSEKVAFVDISDAETVYESYVAAGSAEGSLAEFVALYLLDSSITDASEAGNVYIYEQIMNILSVGCQHVYDNACDESCNKCGEIREAADHVYDNVCDEICNVCGDAREAGHNYVDGVCVNCGEKESIKHVHSYNSCYDTACRVCGETREAEEHAYDNCEDKTCYKCDEVREAIDHVYDSCDDLTCNACGMEREAREHVYSNACDAECNVCGESRTAGEHSYNGCTDADCNVCGEKREVSEHKFDGCADETCNVCGEIVVITGHKYGAWTVTVEATRKNAGEKSRVCSECDHVDTKTIAALGGIGGGAIAAIVVASVVVAGAAGFAIFWFVVQKKSFAALVEMIKGGNAAPAAEEAPKSEEEAPKTEEEAK